MERRTLMWATTIVAIMLAVAICTGIQHSRKEAGEILVPVVTEDATDDPHAPDAASTRPTDPTPTDAPTDRVANPTPAEDPGRLANPAERDAGGAPAHTLTDAGAPDPDQPADHAPPTDGAPNPNDGKPLPPGKIDKEAIREVIGQMKPAVKACYEKTLETFPEAEGTVKLTFEIVAEDGKSHIDLEDIAPDSELQEKELHQCLLDELRTLEFPAPEGGGTVKVTYPFKFANADDPDAGNADGGGR